MLLFYELKDENGELDFFEGERKILIHFTMTMIIHVLIQQI